ncbi:MAG: thiol-disulfide oxidoreductase DCC family protein, partial [Limisphaerales bacterium]
MRSGIQVADPPSKPLMVFDGDCNFCAMWVGRWRQLTGDAVDYAPSQEPRISAQLPEIPREHYEASVQLIEPGGMVFSGAEAVFRTLAKNPKMKWPLRLYET